MKQKIIQYFAVSILLILYPLAVTPQVTIGSAIPPTVGALLELKTQQSTAGLSGANDPNNVTSTNGGFLLPRVQLTAINSLSPLVTQANLTDNPDLAYKLAGLQVYNIATVAVGAQTVIYPAVYTWNGERWEPNASPWNQVNNPTLPSRSVDTDSYIVGKATLGGAFKTPDGAAISIQTQVDADPTQGGVNSTKGFMLPRVKLEASNSLAPIINGGGTTLEKGTHKGLMVYHIGGNSIEPGQLIWDGVKWQRYLTEVPPIPMIKSNTFFLRRTTEIEAYIRDIEYLDGAQPLIFAETRDITADEAPIIIPETGYYAVALRIFLKMANIDTHKQFHQFEGKYWVHIGMYGQKSIANPILKDLYVAVPITSMNIRWSGTTLLPIQSQSAHTETVVFTGYFEKDETILIKAAIDPSFIVTNPQNPSEKYSPHFYRRIGELDAPAGGIDTDETVLIFWKL